MNKSQDEVRVVANSLVEDIVSDLHRILCRIDDPAVAALVLSATENVVMSFEFEAYVFCVNPGPYFEELLSAASLSDPISRLSEIQATLRVDHVRIGSVLSTMQRAVEAAAKLWRPVSVVVSGVRDDGGERR